jgi:hypothetical protein
MGDERTPLTPGNQIDVDRSAEPRRPFAGATTKWTAFLAAGAAVLFIGLVPNLVGDPAGPEDEPGPPTVATTMPAEEETTTTRILPGQVTPPPTVTSLGVFEWARLVGDDHQLPLGDIHVNPFGNGYISYSDGVIWRSPDGLSWTMTEEPSPFPEHSWVESSDNWALALHFERGAQVFRAGAATWVPVELPEPGLPDVEGIRFQVAPRLPLGSKSGVVMIPMSGWGSVPWEDHYGTSTVSCGLPGPCETNPEGWWDSSLGALVVWSYTGGGPTQVATLTLVVEGGSVVFRDAGTGEVIHRVTFDDPAAALEYAKGLERDQPPSTFGVWVSSNGRDFAFHDVPWTNLSSVVALPDGGFAVYAGLFQFDSSAVRLETTKVWTSTDGIDWTDHGTPGFAQSGFQYAEVSARGTDLIATVQGGSAAGRWVSTDGLTWVRQEIILQPNLDQIEPTSFGYAAIDFSANHLRYWVSGDMVEWEEVQGPTNDPAWSSTRPTGAAGAIIYQTALAPAGTRILWIGRLAGP